MLSIPGSGFHDRGGFYFDCLRLHGLGRQGVDEATFKQAYILHTRCYIYIYI